MYIVIIGCGRLGSSLATELSSQGHDVAIIDNNSEDLDRLGSGFNGQRIRGVEYDNDILIEGGIDRADVFLAVTNDDNTNIMASQIAKNIFNVPRVIARVCEPDREFIYKTLGIETVNPTQLASDVIKNRIIEWGSKILAVLDDEMEVVEISVVKSKGKTVEELENNYKCVISSILKEGSFRLPNKNEVVEQGDKIVCAVHRKNREKLISALTKEMFI
jgi:trk system potassium uptake protein TrkA